MRIKMMKENFTRTSKKSILNKVKIINNKIQEKL